MPGAAAVVYLTTKSQTRRRWSTKEVVRHLMKSLRSKNTLNCVVSKLKNVVMKTLSPKYKRSKL